MPTGSIRSIVREKGIGFIDEDNPGEDLSVGQNRFFLLNHHTNTMRDSLRVGMRVSYSLETNRDPSRPAIAIEITPTEDQTTSIEQKINNTTIGYSDVTTRTGVIKRILIEKAIGFIEDAPQDGDLPGMQDRMFLLRHPTNRRYAEHLTTGMKVRYALESNKDPSKPDIAIRVTPISDDGHAIHVDQTSSKVLFNWAYFADIDRTLEKLAGIAIKERWHFGDTPLDDDHHPILMSFFKYTFSRLQAQYKVMYSADKQLAAFNTGLVTKLYDPIIAAFAKNRFENSQPYYFQDFCTLGAGIGKDISRAIQGNLESATYFDNVNDLLYLHPDEEIVLNTEHIIVDGVSRARFPFEFIQEVASEAILSTNFNSQSPTGDDWKRLGDFIKESDKIKRRIKSRINEATDVSLKRVKWNFKTAIPTWSPTFNTIALLLPLSLVDEGITDIALLVEQTRKGNSASYIGHTVLTLDMAYQSARLICRPDSDWLSPNIIKQDKVYFDDVKPEEHDN